MQARSQTAPSQPKAGPGRPSAPAVSSPSAVAVAPEVSRRSAYGLPCAKCGMYYEAALPACPICKSPDRVAPRAIKTQPGVLTSPTQSLPPIAAGTLESVPDAAALEEERERFLRELKAQLDAGLAARSSADLTACARQSVHAPGSENSSAEICRECYDQAREAADRLEGALHMDPKDAAQIIYDAVWADTSDPEQTYVNAAQALLHELRMRSGLPSTPGAPGAPNKYNH